ncbi:MAG TPA: rhodanese-like domain-containing protein [Desulfopila sp.]|nr:rhodanese-like domain-containing protein [Desulfopila sp.]
MRFISVVLAILFAATCSFAASDYNYISPETVQSNIENNVQMLIVDIQVEDEFIQHHIKGSMPTYAYPAKSESDTEKLDIAFQKQKETDEPLVIVCPRGAGGAKRSYDYLRQKGVAEDKLLILEKGMGGWPYPELTVTR